ncbi:hypothetical protein ATANTOWER_023139 [Ataeniobius toweri]|uniref:Uncharacterized protein n=1 Tax=Ataeniobius toweri TaxID=208326 RepID=A0ABU7AIP6_9TELE|nr:hypothetical protein [Ataeniobius toweri]
MKVVMSSECSLVGLQWEEHRKQSSVEVNVLLTHQDKGLAMCLLVPLPGPRPQGKHQICRQTRESFDCELIR